MTTYRKLLPAILLGVEPWVCLQPPPSQGQPRGGPGSALADSDSTHRKGGRGKGSEPDRPEFKCGLYH